MSARAAADERDGGGGDFGGVPGRFGGGSGGRAGAGGSFGGPAPAVGTAKTTTVGWDQTVTGVACARLRDAGWAAGRAVLALRSAPSLRLTPAPGIDVAGIDVAGLRACSAELDARIVAGAALVAELERLHDDTMLAGRAYELASDAVLGLVEEVAGSVAWGLGAAAPALVATAVGLAAPWAALLLLGAGAAVAVGLVTVPLVARLAVTHPQQLAALVGHARAAGVPLDRFMAQTAAFWDRAGEALLATPGFVPALAIAVESTDEALAGLLRIPEPVAARLEATIGQDELFAALAAGAGLGVRAGAGLQPVRAGAVRSLPAPPRPVSAPGEAMRVILAQDDQVTIHEHRMADGSRRFQVFVRGTESWLPDPATGLDGPANLENAGSTPGALLGSDAALAEAMEAAGIGADDPVDLFGYSQGAAAAANVAASERFRVETAMLVGGPVAGTELPPGVAVLSVAHAATRPPRWTASATGMGPVTVTLESAGGHGSGFGARHSGEEYAETLTRARGDDFYVAGFADRLRESTAGGQGVAGWGVELTRTPLIE